MADAAKKQAVILALREARGQLAENISGIRDDFSVGKRFRRSVRQNRVAWYAGAAVLGLLLSRIPSMGKKVIVPRAIFAREPQAGKAAALLAAVKVAVDLGRPMIMTWLRNRVTRRPAPVSRPSRPRPPVVSHV